MTASSAWPAHGHRTNSWRSSEARGPKADRMFTRVHTLIPPTLAKLDLRPSKATERAVIEASTAWRPVSGISNTTVG